MKMTLTHGFIYAEPFYDDAHFPHGFSKSGDFSIAESELLTQLGKRLFMLEQSLCTAENQVEKQFVKMCATQFEGQSKVEVLWQKYKCLTRLKQFHDLNEQTVVKTTIPSNA
jgi:uncharacterized protein YifE (UPF0438 family)